MDWLWKWAINSIKDYVLRNWKTTLIGVLGAVLVKYIPDENLRNTITASILALLGLVAKDGSTTGTAATDASKAVVLAPDPVPVQAGAEPVSIVRDDDLDRIHSGP